MRSERGVTARLFGAVPALAAIVVAAGCAVSIPTETFYTLSPVADGAAAPGAAGGSAAASSPTAAASAPTSGAITVMIEPVKVPELVDRPQLVVSIGDAKVAPLEQQRWAEPLRAQIGRVLALDLARELPAARVSSAEDALEGVDPARAFRVSLDVQRFETRPGDSATIEAAWTVRRGPGGAAASGDVVASGRERVREPAADPGYDGAIRAHNRGLAAVGRTIAAALRPVATAGNRSGN